MENASNPNQARKEKHEWAAMLLFRTAYTSFPLGEIEKSECPDFLIHTNKGLIGVEVTELKYDKNDSKFNPRGHEKWLESIMDKAMEDFESRHKEKLIVDVHFRDELGPTVSHPKEPPSMLLHDGLKESLLHIVEDNVPEATGQQYTIDRTSKYGYQNLPQLIEAIYITNATGRYREGLWYAGISTKIKPLSIQSINERVRDKNIKLQHYNSNCRRTWLLIVQNSFFMSSHYDARAAYKALHHKYMSKFDKIFVLERSAGTVSELPTLQLKKMKHDKCYNRNSIKNILKDKPDAKAISPRREDERPA